MSVKTIRRLSRVIARSLLFFSCLVLIPPALNCNLPAGCGPGVVPTAPMFSNLIDFTYPASGSILRPSTFQSFEVYFLRYTLKDSFEIGRDMRMWQVPEGQPYDPENPGTPVDVTEIFSQPSWPDFKHCNQQNTNYCDKLVMVVNASSLGPGLYAIRFIEGSFVSDEGYSLEDNADVLLRVVSDSAETEPPFLWATTDIPVWTKDNTEPFRFVSPHKLLKFGFSQEMGAMNYVPSTPWGFNFSIETLVSPPPEYYTTSLVKTDSTQGLEPGIVYQLDFLSKDAMPRGVPFSMDLNGNPLSGAAGYLHPETTATYLFETSHVRILFPKHDPFSEVADDWSAQLDENGYEQPVIKVQVSGYMAAHYWLTSLRCEMSEGDATIRFDPVKLKNQEGLPFVEIPISSIKEECVGADLNRDQLLTVHARELQPDGQVSWLGSDSLHVNPFPPDYVPEVPTTISYIGEYPSEMQRSWVSNIQGVANDDEFWYFTNTHKISKFPISQDLDSVPESSSVSIDDLIIGGLKYNHFGDLDYYKGYLVVPIEKKDHTDKPGIAIFDASTLEYLAYYKWPVEASQDASPWCAVDSDGFIYSSSAHPDSINKYYFDWNEFMSGSYIDVVPIFEEDESISVQLNYIQGGDISDNGHLYTVNGYAYGDSSSGAYGIMTFKKTLDGNWIRQSYSNNVSGIGGFNFEFHPGSPRYEEPEGITIQDFSSDTSPGISGQIHVILLNNDEWYDIGDDDMSFKHYQVAYDELCKI